MSDTAQHAGSEASLGEKRNVLSGKSKRDPAESPTHVVKNYPRTVAVGKLKDVRIGRPRRENSHQIAKMKISGVTKEGNPFEAIYYQDKPMFLVRTTPDQVTVMEKVVVEGVEYLPPKREDLPYPPYGWYSGPPPTKQELYDMIKREHQRYEDSDPIYHVINAADELVSCVQHQLQSVHIQLIIGDVETGKTLVLQVHNAVVYRPLFSVMNNAADIYGFLEQHGEGRCTILEDEIDGIERDILKTKIFKSGYKPGAKVPRYRDTPEGQKLVYFPTFCLKIVTSEVLPTGFRSKGLTTRVILQQMTPGHPPQEWADQPEERDKRQNELRNKLLAWRLYNYDQKLPDLNLSSLGIKGRLRDIYEPLLQVLYGLPDYDILLKYVQQIGKDRFAELEDSLEGNIVKAVWQLIGSTDKTIVAFEHVWNKLLDELDGTADNFRPSIMHTSEFGDVSKNKVGYRLREVLGGKRDVVRSKQGKPTRVYVLNREKLARVARRYGCYQVTKITKSSGVAVQQTLPLQPRVEPKTSLPQAQETNVSLPTLGKLGNSVTSLGGSCASSQATDASVSRPQQAAIQGAVQPSQLPPNSQGQVPEDVKRFVRLHGMIQKSFEEFKRLFQSKYPPLDLFESIWEAGCEVVDDRLVLRAG